MNTLSSLYRSIQHSVRTPRRLGAHQYHYDNNLNILNLFRVFQQNSDILYELN